MIAAVPGLLLALTIWLTVREPERPKPPPDAPAMRTLNWLATSLQSRGECSTHVCANSIMGVRAAVAAGLGLGGLPDFVAATDPTLVRVAPQIQGPDLPIYFVYAESLRSSRRIAAFRDFLRAELADTESLRPSRLSPAE